LIGPKKETSKKLDEGRRLQDSLKKKERISEGGHHWGVTFTSSSGKCKIPKGKIILFSTEGKQNKKKKTKRSLLIPRVDSHQARTSFPPG